MEAILYGFFGAILSISLVAIGGAAGWLIHASVLKHTKPTVPPVAEQERRRLKEEQAAFKQLQAYSAEQAYGIEQVEAEGDEK